MFEHYRPFALMANGVEIQGVIGGEGPPLLLLHGYPQTHVMWHKVAGDLAEHFTVVAADLRGYGRSSKPDPAPDHSTYSKRAMARDMVDLMHGLGFDRFAILAHDRGARVAHRLALDSPESVVRMVLLDIAPTREMYAHADASFARAYWHWFFLIRPSPLPERMIGADPRAYWVEKCGAGSAGLNPFTPDALAAYLDAFDDPRAIAASCEDYRAAVTIDILHDDQDGGKKVACPIRVLWGEKGVIEAHFDCLALWRERAEQVDGEALPGGHYLAEELPDQVVGHTLEFLHQGGA
ncbi:MAG: alpha/beta hydrolase [Gemmatimonadales bacterium]|jgi:haloacetate dehalogenase|nr:alpha/beta hydrolase [Gemmatimonadales bacterium]MDG2238999.1 alpha/beta hydrolase [Longimicrobiales bacterium]NCG33796.1 alpha/beta fold hydrolase [Pseudomonadota bacterium]MBT4437799.1 alpha/beta hydrolase [Gemmatimonadales bacterium]MBT4912249.1 alpha/beta hydrolase [Gemmatimonadales bacterium]